MKTIITRVVLSSLAVLAIASGCSKENDYSKDNDNKKQVTIFASIPDGGMETKVALTQPGGIKSAIKVAWATTDAITINGEVFAIDATSISVDGKSAKFTGNDPGAGPYTISYSSFPIDLSAQTQSEDGNLDHLRYSASITGVDSYDNVSFTTGWATSHSGTLSTSSVIELQALLPAAISSKVKKVIFTFPEEITADNKRITVTLTTKGVQGADNKLDVYATLPAGNINLPNILVQFQIQEDAEDLAYKKYSAYREFAPTKVVAGGSTLYLGMNCSNIQSYANASNDNIGESTNPYLIGDQYQMKALMDLYSTADSADNKIKKYVILVDDVDMTGVGWTPLNRTGNYGRAIDFNGNNKTISKLSCTHNTYPSFFGVLNGSCYDVSFMNASIECSAAKSCGILGGYGGTTSVAETEIHADVSRVHVHGTVTLTGNKTGAGGMFGVAGDATITRCSANVVVNSGKNYVGGLVGYSTKAQITDCWVGGSVKGNQRVGGIIGGLNGNDDSVRDSYCVAKLYILDGENKVYAAAQSVGGIVGHANQDKGNDMETRTPGNVVSGCIAWEDELKTRTNEGATPTHDYYSSGAIVAFGATHNTYENCYRNPNLDFRDYTSFFLLYDQENSSPTSPLTHQTVTGSSYNYPYHGKAAAVGKTVSDLAQELGWNASYWDFSTDLPTLK